MRNALSSALPAVLLIGAVAAVGCGDDASDPNPSNVPGVSSNTSVDDETGNDQDVGRTSLPALTAPQMTPAPNPDAGGGGEADVGSAP